VVSPPALFDRNRLDAELDRELEDHIARETRANVARGMSEREARRTALAAFGGTQRYKKRRARRTCMHAAEEIAAGRALRAAFAGRARGLRPSPF
jgi:hypothetical protein